ncbi:MAG TPA: phage tail protein [Alphaproteobacteria bacterium]|nr:phage tail protein [Alphaproteobacteria bacterium]
MGGLFGGKKSNSRQQPTVLNSIRVQSSVYGLAIPIVYGQQRVGANLIWYGDFVATAHESGGGGKGGGGGGGEQTTHTYSAAVALALCEGPVGGIARVWQDKSATTLGSLNLALFNGAPQQPAWGHLVTRHPEAAIGYEGVAYVASPSYFLGDNPDLPNHNFEVEGRLRYKPMGGVVDANPAEIIVDLLINPDYGAGFPAGAIGDLSDYSKWCVASGLFLSPLVNEQRPAHEILDALAMLTNSAFVWSAGRLRLVTFADETATGDGAIYTPDLSPAYDIADDDFLVEGAEDPVECVRTPSADAFNVWQLEFLNRENQYSPQIAEAKDQANIEEFGERAADVVTAHEIARADTAQTIVQFLLQRGLYVRNRYRFCVGWKFALLEPMDLVTISDPALGLDRQLVRVMEIEEDDEGRLAVTAEEVPVGVSTPARFASPPIFGYTVDYRVPPGDAAAPIIFDAPPALAESGLEVWLAAFGGPNWGGAEVWVSSDGQTYRRAGMVSGPARIGFLTAALAAGPDPDTTNVLAVDLAPSRGALMSGTKSDADMLRTLCWVDGELIAYRDADLVAQYRYNLSYLRRGGYETPAVGHAAGARFVRLDGAIFKLPYARQEIGQTIYVKLASLNIYGGAPQDLSGLVAYPYRIMGPPAPPAVTGFSAVFADGAVAFRWDPIETHTLAGYILRFAPAGTAWDAMTLLSTNDAGTHLTTVALPPGLWEVAIRAVDVIDQLSADTARVSVMVQNFNDAIYGAPQEPAWLGTIVGFVRHWTGALVPDSKRKAADKSGFETFDRFVDEPVDLCRFDGGAVTLTFPDMVRVWAEFAAELGAGETTGHARPRLLISYTTGDDDPAMWSDDGASLFSANAALMWSGFGDYVPWSVGDIDIAAVRFRVESRPADGISVLRGFRPVVDVPPASQAAAGISVGPGGTTIVFDKPFHRTPSIRVTPQGALPLIATVGDPAPTGFMVRLFDMNGAPAAGTCDWQASTE